MKIILGTTSIQKGEIARKAINLEPLELVQLDVESGITDQPLDEKTTIKGSINRAQNARKKIGDGNYDVALGLEGGLEMVGGTYHLVCSAAVVNKKGDVFIGVSRKLPLPSKVSKIVENGGQFGVVIREFFDSMDKSENKMIAHVNQLISREDAFTEAIQEAFKQYGLNIFFE